MTRNYGQSGDHQPLLWLRDYPVYATHLIVGIFVISMLGTTGMMFFGSGRLLDALPFRSGRVLDGEVWRLLTYGLVNPPSLWFAVKMVMIIWFGRELERFFGRRVLLHLYGGLYLFLPVVFTGIGFLRPMSLAGEPGSFALFIAFATLYPNVVMLFNLLAKWVAGALVAIYALIAISQRDTSSILLLMATVGFAYGFVRYQQGHIRLPGIRLPRIRLARRGPDLRVLPTPPQTQGPRKTPVRKENLMTEIDAILDKIAQSGYASLTSKEKDLLDAAREKLRQRNPGRH